MSETHRWIRTALCEDIPLREARSVRLGGRDIAIFNLGDRILAIDNRCPHKGGPLSDGIVSGDTVICPLHAWKVGLETGQVVRPADTMSCVETFPVRVESGVISVGFPVESAPKKEFSVVCVERGGLASISKQSHLKIDDSDSSSIPA